MSLGTTDTCISKAQEVENFKATKFPNNSTVLTTYSFQNCLTSLFVNSYVGTTEQLNEQI